MGLLAIFAEASEKPLASQEAPAEIWGSPRPEEVDAAAPAVLELTFAADKEIPAARVSGVLTAVAELAGVVSTGDVLYEVDGRPVFAVVGEQPPHSALQWGDSGANAASQASLLEALGYLPEGQDEASAVVHAEFVAALQAMALDLGYSDLSAAPSQVFAHIVWIPLDEPADGIDMSVRVGEPAPTYPEPIGVHTGALIAAGTTIPESLGGEWVFEGDQFTVNLGSDGRVEPGGVSRLATLYEPGDEPAGTLRLATPLEVWLVPASAVLVGPEGERCVLVRRGRSLAVVAVDVVAAQMPGAALAADLGGAEILLNATGSGQAEISRPATCPP